MAVGRRSFIKTTAALAGATVFPPLPSPSRTRASFLLKGGLVYDGTGAPPFEVDVAVNGDRITQIGASLSVSGAEELDVRGLSVAPGFVDIHSHTDLELFIDARAESKVRQGVTTEIVGQDGNSIGPWTDEQAASIGESYRSRFGVDISFTDLRGFFTALDERGAAVNIASMIGHGTIRGYVMGNADERASEEQLEKMVRIVEEALEAGACGFSTGLEYIPGAFADLNELASLCRPLRARGLPYATHMRNEDDGLLSAIEEALGVGQQVGAPVHISHLKAQGERNWWKAGAVLHMLEEANEHGLQVTYDRYPYVAYSTGLSSLLPVWAREGGTDSLLARLADASVAPRIEDAVRGKVALLGSWDAVQVTSTAADSLSWARGRRLGELSAEQSEEPYALFLRIVTGDRNRSGMVGFGMSEENTASFLAHPAGMICSDGSALATDGPLSSGSPHPRNYGTFPRILGHYCRDHNLMPIETGIQKMTSMPAKLVRLDNRGTVKPGVYADLVVFDPATIADRATFANPHQYPIGIPHVMVNGEFVVRDGEHTGATPGRVLRAAERP